MDDFGGRANWADGKAWLFFENRTGYKFKPLEELAAISPIKKYTQYGTIGADNDASMLEHHILNYKIISRLNVEQAVKSGALQTEVTTHNQRTREVETKKTVPASFGSIGDAMRLLYSKVGRSLNIPTTSRIPETGIPASTPEQAAAASGLMQLIVLAQVFGDPALEAGSNVEIELGKPAALSENNQIDPLVQGNFLISKLRHEISHKGFQPRYSCSLECLRKT